MNSKLENAVLRYVEVSSTLGKRALDSVTQSKQAEKAASALVPAVLQSMLDTGVLKPTQKQAAEQMLGNHADTLNILASAIEKLAAAKAEIAKSKTVTGGDRLGKAEKEAGDTDTTSRPRSVVVGARTSEKKGSDNALFKGLGLGHLASNAT